MKWILIFFLFFGVSSSAATLRPWKESVLKNGLRVLMVEDRALPYFTIGVMVESGAVRDPIGKAGLSSMVASLLEKGTEKRNARGIAEALGQLGADFSQSVDQDYTLLSTGTLSSKRKELLELFSEMLISPKFDKSEVERLKGQLIGGLQQLPDNPSGFASWMFYKFLYGEHPYGLPVSGTIETVKGITRTNIIRHYFKYFRPGNSRLLVVGTFDPKTIIAELENAFGSWGNRKVQPVTFPALKPPAKMQIRLVHKPDLTQAQIRIGHFGIRRNDDSYLTSLVANNALGAGFSSRLMDEIRDNLGLTYGISSSFDGREDRGPFVISTFTRNEKVGQTIQKTLEILKKFRDEGMTEKEIETARGYLKGIFPRAMETAEGLAMALARLRRYGVSDDYLLKFEDRVNDLSRSKVHEFIKKTLTPERATILVFANKKEVLTQLKAFGEVEVVDYREALKLH